MSQPSSTFTLEATAFAEGEAIPGEFSCQGDSVSPPSRGRVRRLELRR